MGFADQYLTKQKGFIPHISSFPSEHLRFAVVIPAFCEPDLTDSLESLWKCARPAGHTEVIIVINSAENADQEIIQSNQSTLHKASQWIAGHQDPVMRFFIIDKLKMPVSDAGVGLARKTGMDEAIYRFNLINNPYGYILSFDADSQCDSNYFSAIEEAVNTYRAMKGFTVYFEHPVLGTGFPEKVFKGAVDYELHLRYVNQFLHNTGFPFAHHTVGSCFGVRADIYTAQGGMNKRKAGEDFYFLHKVIPLGQFIDINTTRVIPSPRVSSRVPFGTGTAISKYLVSEEKEINTYAPECFLSLKQLFNQVPALFKITPDGMNKVIDTLPLSLKDFLCENNVSEAVMEINNNSGSPDSFCNRFYRWFDAFRIVKYLNFSSRAYFKKVPVSNAAKRFLAIIGYANRYEHADNLELLAVMRGIERGW